MNLFEKMTKEFEEVYKPANAVRTNDNSIFVTEPKPSQYTVNVYDPETEDLISSTECWNNRDLKLTIEQNL